MEDDKIVQKTNIVAYTFKCMAFVYLIVGILILLSFNFAEKEIVMPFLTFILPLIGIVISFIFIYAIGEIIQIIHDIRKRLYETTEVKEEKEQIVLSDEN